MHKAQEESLNMADLKARITALEEQLRARGIEPLPANSALNNQVFSAEILMENLPCVVYRLFLRENNRMLFLNDAIHSLTGYGANQLSRGKIHSIDPFIVPDDFEPLEKIIQQAIQTMSSYQAEYRIHTKQREIRFCLEKGKVIPGPDGKPFCIDGVIFDITERKRIEETARENEERLTIILNTVNAGIVVTDLENLTIVEANDQAAQMVHKSRDELIGLPCKSLFCFSHSAECPHREASPQNRTLEREITDDSGKRRIIRKHLAHLSLHGKPHLLEVLSDETNRYALEEMWKRYEFIVNTSKDFLTLVTRDFVYQAVNEAYCQAHGKAREEIIGKTVKEIWGTAAFDKIYPYFSRCFSGELVNYQMDFEFLAIGHRYFDVTYYPYAGDNGVVSHAVVVSRDITDRRNAESARDLLAKAIQQSAEGVLITDTKGTINYVNPAFEAASGYSATELIDKNPRLLNSGAHDSLFFQKLWATISEGETWKGNIINRRKNGSLFQESVIISPVFNHKNVATHFVSIRQDVTQEIAREKHLQQSQKLEAIGTLAGGIAHDFNNILTAVNGFADLVRLEVVPESDMAENVGQIIIASKRAQELIAQILTFSRQAEQKQAPCHLHQIILEAVNLLRATFPKTIDFRVDVEKSQVAVMADPTKIHQVLMNLCTNALQALPDETGVIEVKLHPLKFEAEFADYLEGLPPGMYQCLSVRDNGAGIDRNVLDRIFEPYFTTKGVGEGTGLGLSVVHGIVKEHAGVIKITSEVGKGTTFTVFFPCFLSAESKGNMRAPVVARGQGRVLLIDDEPALVEYGKKALSFLGYQVIGAIGGPEGFERFRQSPREFDLVFSDHAMPRMTGFEIAREIRKIRADIPIIICTGFSSGTLNHEKARAEGINRLVRKPITVSELSRLLHEVLAEAKGE